MVSWLGDAISAALQKRADALDAAVSEAMWLPPAEHLIRRAEVPLGEAMLLPGEMFPDGRDRLMVHPKQELHPDELAKYRDDL